MPRQLVRLTLETLDARGRLVGFFADDVPKTMSVGEAVRLRLAPLVPPSLGPSQWHSDCCRLTTVYKDKEREIAHWRTRVGDLPFPSYRLRFRPIGYKFNHALL